MDDGLGVGAGVEYAAEFVVVVVGHGGEGVEEDEADELDEVVSEGVGGGGRWPL